MWKQLWKQVVSRNCKNFQIHAKNIHTRNNSADITNVNVIEKQGKIISFQKVLKDIAEPCSSALLKVEFVSKQIEYLAEISKHIVEGVDLTFLSTYTKWKRGEMN